MNVTFYTFVKTSNSTKRPGGGKALSVVLKDNCSVTEPRFVIDKTFGNPSQYNYCYSSDFGRYYYVKWQYEIGVWVAYCTVDVMATYKAEIGASTLYVLRSSAAYDGNVVDTLYPAKYGVDIKHSFGALGWTVNTPQPDNGTYIVGLINNNDTIAGAVSYYALTGAEMAQFRAFMLKEIKEWDNVTDFSGDLAKAFIDPFQYVVSCIWFPFDVPKGEAVPLSFGFWQSDVSGCPLTRFSVTFTTTLPRPARTDTDGRNWLYLSPFATYYLYAMPWGIIEIDGTAITDAGIRTTIEVDLATGLAVLSVNTLGTDPAQLIVTQTANVGVQMQLAQITTDYAGLAKDSGGGLIKSLINGIGGNLVAGLDSFFRGESGGNIASAAQAGSATVKTSGSTGGMTAVCKGAAHILYAKYLTPVDEDKNLWGRPLCQNRLISSIPGYIQCANGEVAISGTALESETVRGYLEGGFLYE